MRSQDAVAAVPAFPLVYLIPAYHCSARLLPLLRDLRALTPDPIVVIDDGGDVSSVKAFRDLQRLPGVELLHHSVNLGKGAALKTGIRHILHAHADVSGIVTLDADGQHLPKDAVRVGKALIDRPGTLILGSRGFDGLDPVPLRSRLGNRITREVFRLATGRAVSDTQTGLRAIPAAFAAEVLSIGASGYDFETEMLLGAVRRGRHVREVAIATVYHTGNAGSHFHPVWDSLKVGAALARFGLHRGINATLFSFVRRTS